MAVCERYLKIAYTVTGYKQALMTRLRCKQWTCDYCAKKNAGIWQYWLIKRLPEVSGDWYLVTLTAHSKKRTELASFDNLRKNIDALIKRARRVWGKGIQYARVYERHPSSEAIHVHFIMCGLTPFVENSMSSKKKPVSRGVVTRKGRKGTWSTKTWFKKACHELKMGYMADVKRLTGTPEQAAYYVTKYLTKDQGSFHVPHLRHIQVTQGIGAPEFEKKYDWKPVSYLVSGMFEPNTQITDIDTGFVVNNNFWEHTGYYPNDQLDIDLT